MFISHRKPYTSLKCVNRFRLAPVEREHNVKSINNDVIGHRIHTPYWNAQIAFARPLSSETASTLHPKPNTANHGQPRLKVHLHSNHQFSQESRSGDHHWSGVVFKYYLLLGVSSEGEWHWPFSGFLGVGHFGAGAPPRKRSRYW